MYLRPASWAAITASPGLLRRDAGELDQHRQVDAGDHLDGAAFITEMARLEGVPPNMSVRTMTPDPISTGARRP